MEEKYNKFISEASKAGWIIEMATHTNGNIKGWICHDSWVTNNLYASRTLPVFYGYTIENILDQIMEFIKE